MRDIIEKIRNHIKNRDNLAPDSVWITLLVLLLIFLFAQIFGFSSRIEKEDKIVRIELRERTPPLKFARKNERPKRKKAKGPVSRKRTPNTAKTKKSERAKPKTKSADLSSLVKSFNPKKFLKSENNIKRTVNQRASQTTSISKTLTRSTKSAVSVNDLSLEVSSGPTTVPGGGRGAPSASQS
ncbi:MAG: hypothetical protein ACE5I1_00950, partial [bacterium]